MVLREVQAYIAGEMTGRQTVEVIKNGLSESTDEQSLGMIVIKKQKH